VEVLRDGINGLTVDFFAHQQLASYIEAALANPEELAPMRRAARATAVEQFDLKRVLLPRWTALFDDLIQGRRPGDALAGSSTATRPIAPAAA
jgi:glycosyltransferase involved in cell wall biosynthesis